MQGWVTSVKCSAVMLFVHSVIPNALPKSLLLRKVTFHICGPRRDPHQLLDHLCRFSSHQQVKSTCERAVKEPPALSLVRCTLQNKRWLRKTALAQTPKVCAYTRRENEESEATGKLWPSPGREHTSFYFSPGGKKKFSDGLDTDLCVRRPHMGG